MIKYLGSKRRFTDLLGMMAEASGASTALDVFTGTTRVAQEFRRRGIEVTAIDSARYSEVFAQTYLELRSSDFEPDEITNALSKLNALPGKPGYVTRTFCEEARYFTPENGARIDAIRDYIEANHKGTPLYPILLTSLILAADKVDSTVGLQMAYLKKYAARALNDMVLLPPIMIDGPRGHAVRGDAATVLASVGRVDLAYLDPPYNQHSYFGNYHIWETLVAWDAPEAYGIARKRIDTKESKSKSAFNRKHQIADAMRQVLGAVNAPIVILSFNNEGYLTLAELTELCKAKGCVRVLAFDYKRYVGAQIGIYNPSGVSTGTVSHLRNLEYVIVCGEDADSVDNVVAAAQLVSLDLYGSEAVDLTED